MKYSLKKNKEFKKVYNTKNSYATKSIVLFVLKNNGMERNRLGISVSKKIGNSVIRHTLIRRMREIFIKNEKNLKKENDIIVIFRIGSEKQKFEKLNEEFIRLCKKHEILKKEIS